MSDSRKVSITFFLVAFNSKKGPKNYKLIEKRHYNLVSRGKWDKRTLNRTKMGR